MKDTIKTFVKSPTSFMLAILVLVLLLLFVFSFSNGNNKVSNPVSAETEISIDNTALL